MRTTLKDLGKVPAIYAPGEYRTWLVETATTTLGSIKRRYPMKCDNPYNARIHTTPMTDLGQFKSLKQAQQAIETAKGN